MTKLGTVGNYNFQKRPEKSPLLKYPQTRARTMWSDEFGIQSSEKIHAEYEWRYEQFRRKYTSGIPLEQIADELGVQVKTLKDRHYLGRLKKGF
ncbi:hypothetical protein [Pediococcus pentosaceus]|uniref:hypothetical protein n=1 Tax=Pediococcus pentosaceus TaxID=1255 RepID=UPI003982AC90